jgi:primosomal protein N' (replication factor Y) (superfamily II helicase)
VASILSLIHLSDSVLQAPLISHELTVFLEEAHKKGEKTLLLYNRRGSGRAWICQDCGYFPLCPHCDIALAYHTTPRKNLICHHCNYIISPLYECPQCQSHAFSAVGIGIQRIEDDMRSIFPLKNIVRIDSDTHAKKSELLAKVKNANMILSTYGAIGLLTQVDRVVFLLFESDLTIPDYRMEEEVFHAIDYAKKLEKDILLQTQMRDHPLLDIVMTGNYRDFLTYMSHERELFHYPPYTEFATLKVHSHVQSQVTDIISKLVNKIALLKRESTFFSYDRDIWDRSAGEWIQKILLKDTDLSYIIDALQGEILRNRAVSLEWR